MTAEETFKLTDENRRAVEYSRLLLHCRKRLKLSQRQMAALLGIHRTQVRRVEDVLVQAFLPMPIHGRIVQALAKLPGNQSITTIGRPVISARGHAYFTGEMVSWMEFLAGRMNSSVMRDIRDRWDDICK